MNVPDQVFLPQQPQQGRRLVEVSSLKRVGQESRLKGAYTFQFPGGGLPGPGGSGVRLQYEKKSADCATYAEAVRAYCNALESPPRRMPLMGGSKAKIYGAYYWVDTAPPCPR